MEMSLSLVGRRSEQDPAASSVGGQPPHCSVSRKYVDAPAVSKLTFIPPGTCTAPPSGWGSPPASTVVGEEGMGNTQRSKLFSVHTREYSSSLQKPGWPFYRRAHTSSPLLKGNWGNAFILPWLLEKKATQLTYILAPLTVSYLKKFG